MDDKTLLALNVYEEAAGEPINGRAAIARVVKNRMAHHFFSDGTIQGTVLAKDQFSWAWFGFVAKVSGTVNFTVHPKPEYVRICHTMTEAQALADSILKRTVPKVLAACGDVAQQVMEGTYYDPLFSKLGNDAVSYLNPRILTKLPKWAIPSKLVVSIGHHDFYRA